MFEFMEKGKVRTGQYLQTAFSTLDGSPHQTGWAVPMAGRIFNCVCVFDGQHDGGKVSVGLIIERDGKEIAREVFKTPGNSPVDLRNIRVEPGDIIRAFVHSVEGNAEDLIFRALPEYDVSPARSRDITDELKMEFEKLKEDSKGIRRKTLIECIKLVEKIAKGKRYGNKH